VKPSTSFGRPRPAEPPSETAVRIATALLMTFAAALVLLHAQAYGGGLPHTPTPLWGASASTADPR
jgi:hypothetical protein